MSSASSKPPIRTLLRKFETLVFEHDWFDFGDFFTKNTVSNFFIAAKHSGFNVEKSRFLKSSSPPQVEFSWWRPWWKNEPGRVQEIWGAISRYLKINSTSGVSGLVGFHCKEEKQCFVNRRGHEKKRLRSWWNISRCIYGETCFWKSRNVIIMRNFELWTTRTSRQGTELISFADNIILQLKICWLKLFLGKLRLSLLEKCVFG